MRYELFINGGFANIPKRYQGEITLKDAEKKELFDTLCEKPKPSPEIPDGFRYHIRIIDKDSEMKSVYDEHNLPNIIRTFIESILLKKK